MKERKPSGRTSTLDIIYGSIADWKFIKRDEFALIMNRYTTGAIGYHDAVFAGKQCSVKAFYLLNTTLAVGCLYGYSVKRKRLSGAFIKIGSDSDWQEFESEFAQGFKNDGS